MENRVNFQNKTSRTDSGSCFTSQNRQKKKKPFNYIAYSSMVTQSQRVNDIRQARHSASQLLPVGYEAVWRTKQNHHNVTEVPKGLVYDQMGEGLTIGHVMKSKIKVMFVFFKYATRIYTFCFAYT